MNDAALIVALLFGFFGGFILAGWASLRIPERWLVVARKAFPKKVKAPKPVPEAAVLVTSPHGR